MHESPLLPLHRAASARITAPEQGARLLTYGDVPAEYRAANEGAALFDRTERGLVRVTGADAPAFLHRIVAGEVRGLDPGTGGRNLLLSPKGKVLFDFDLLPCEGGFELSTTPGQAGALRESLDVYLFAEDVELADVTESHAPLEITGPTAAAVLERAFGSPPPAKRYQPVHIEWEGAPVALVALAVAGSPGFRIDGGPALAEPLWNSLTAAAATPAGLVVWDILRVEACAAEPGVDVDETVYPQEARLEAAFSLEKGCYVGQEVVAKIDTYGGLNKLLVTLRVDHDDPVASGTRLYRQDEKSDEWRDLGVVTSWAYSFVLDTGLVLAYVKRRHQDVGTRFQSGRARARRRSWRSRFADVPNATSESPRACPRSS